MSLIRLSNRQLCETAMESMNFPRWQGWGTLIFFTVNAKKNIARKKRKSAILDLSALYCFMSILIRLLLRRTVICLKKNRAHWKINSLKTKEKCIKRCSNYVGLFKIYTSLSILGRLHTLKHRKIFFYLDLSYHFLVLVPLIFRSVVSNEERKD